MSINGSQLLMQTLIDNGVEVCFGNPGTSEMHLVDAISKADGIQGVLCLFEGVVTGAADGYARMAEKPAATLLHLGPGLANGTANLHNAKRARSPMINIIGQHATSHLQYDAPLTSDIEAIAKPFSHWVKTTHDINQLSHDTAQAIIASSRGAGEIASLIVPADLAWSHPQSSDTIIAPKLDTETVTDDVIQKVLALLKNTKTTALLIDDACLFGESLIHAGRVAKATGATLICPTFFARAQRGAGTVPVTRIPYFAEAATEVLKDFEQVILVGGQEPVSFFAYPNKPSWLLPDGCVLTTLTQPHQDSKAALLSLVDKLEAESIEPVLEQPQLPSIPMGDLTPEGAAACIAKHLPIDSIIIDEGVTSSLPAYPMTAGAARHDWLTLTGGAIGQGLPAAVGAAVACPDRKVVCLEGDGSAMYTVQALWTMANQNLDITVVLYANHSYKILNVEMIRVGVESPTPKASEMLDIGNPNIDWVAMAQSMGVSASKAKTVNEFEQQFSQCVGTQGPHLIVACVSKEL